MNIFFNLSRKVREKALAAINWFHTNTHYKAALQAAVVVLVAGLVIAPLIAMGNDLPLLGLFLAVLGYFLHWFAAVYVVAYFHGRLGREYEVAGVPVRKTWILGLIPWDNMFKFPILGALAAACVVQLVRLL